MKHYDESELLDRIRSMAIDGEPPSCKEMDEAEGPSSALYHSRFGSWNEAVKKAGLEPRTAVNGYDREELLDYIRELADGGEPPTQAEFNEEPSVPSSNTVKNKFGRWNEAVSQAGFDREPGERPSSVDGELVRKYSDEELFEWIESYIREFDELPGYNEVDNWPGPSYQCYRSRFGGLEGTFEEMGIDLEKFETKNRHYE